MQTFSIPTNVDICLFASQQDLIELLTLHPIPSPSLDSKNETLRIASRLVEMGETVALEVKVNGIQRDQRAPIARWRNGHMELLKVCVEEKRLENAIYTVHDLITTASKNKRCKLRLVGVVIYNGVMHAGSANELADSLGVKIVGEQQLNGLFNQP